MDLVEIDLDAIIVDFQNTIYIYDDKPEEIIYPESPKRDKKRMRTYYFMTDD